MEVTIRIPTIRDLARHGKWAPLLIGAGVIVALLLLFPPHGPDRAAGLHAMPCADLDGDTDVDWDDVNIVVSYFGKTVPTAPAQVNNFGDAQIRTGDITYVVGLIGTTTGCQDEPIACQGGPCPTKTPTMLPPTPTFTPTPSWEVNIANYGQYPLPKACFEVRDASETPLFEVCDNDFQGTAESDAVCVPDGVCNDEDATQGSVRVSIAAGDYRMVESKAPPNHTVATSKQTCDATTAKCTVTFINTPNTRPWHPWDINNDGIVRTADITAVVLHYGQDKPPGPCADLDGDGDVDVDDRNIVVSYYGQSVPPAPAQVDMDGNGIIQVPDISYVVGQIGTTTGCQGAPVACQGGPCPTKTPTAVPTPTPP